MNNNIVYFLESLKSDLPPNEKSKKIAYSKIIGIIKDLDYIITKDTKLSDVKGIGKKTELKIRDFLSSDCEPTKEELFEKELNKVTGIGVKKAKDIVKLVNNFEDLEVQKNDILNKKQIIGLKYYKSDNMRIPRSEMIQHKEFIGNIINKINDSIKFQIVGSFRRGNSDSGDIDLILTHDNNILKDIIENLILNNYIIDTYANGKKKFMGWCILPTHDIPRRLDILYTDKTEFPFSILYFTGSRNYNKFMRLEAIKQNLTLNEHGLYDKKTKKQIEHDFISEYDIFKYLNINYKEPCDRL